MEKNANKSIVLVGMMGSGKSVIGKKLATKIAMPFIDSDNAIEKAMQMTVSEIFAQHGEPHFRKIEADMIAEILQKPPSVLSCGGGAFCHAPTRKICKKSAISIYLSTPINELWTRVKDQDHRPLVQNGFSAFQELLKARANDYQQADIIIDCKNKSRQKITNEILEQINA